LVLDFGRRVGLASYGREWIGETSGQEEVVIRQLSQLVVEEALPFFEMYGSIARVAERREWVEAAPDNINIREAMAYAGFLASRSDVAVADAEAIMAYCDSLAKLSPWMIRVRTRVSSILALAHTSHVAVEAQLGHWADDTATALGVD
jgi:hypothetical protein